MCLPAPSTDVENITVTLLPRWESSKDLKVTVNFKAGAESTLMLVFERMQSNDKTMKQVEFLSTKGFRWNDYEGLQKQATFDGIGGPISNFELKIIEQKHSSVEKHSSAELEDSDLVDQTGLVALFPR